ncbi:MAG TPA: circadian clock KaiB family protein [Tepidisphaeraceae bacterium]|jgi:circadian clock protein KaiB|nr:circadian clock KaiB family protein [Tepidisphaeraceae bacterium]
MSAKSTLSDEPKSTGPGSARDGTDRDKYTLRLYVAGQTAKSIAAFANLKRLCEEYLPGRYKLEVIDLVENPQLAAGDQIFALPTLVRRLPPPLRRIIGNFSNKDKFLIGMDLKEGD